MTDHEHMPPINRYTARWLSSGKVIVQAGQCTHVLSWEEARVLAEAITEALQLEAANWTI